ncbi:dna replication licensing factor mcm2 [Hordeum vulgare]|nr:dna replication licensing factor mcm2 [Hordeum vulgare]
MVPHLAVVALDSGIVFRGEKGPPLEQISALCAKERFEGALAEARAVAARGEPSPSVPTKPGHRETRDGGVPSTVGGTVTPRVGPPLHGSPGDVLPPVSTPRSPVEGCEARFPALPPQIRGFSLTVRRQQLIDYMRQEDIDIMGLQETIRQDFSMLELQRLCRHHFAWQWLPATGHSRGILLGVREDAFSVEHMDRGEFFDIRLGLRISVGNGAGTQFWLDPWLDGEPLRLRFPRLFAICGDPAALVAVSAREDGWHVPFRHPLGPAEVQEWDTLQAAVPLPVSSDRDYAVWSLSPSGNFSVSSAYLALCRTPVLPWLSPLWKAPLPLKIQIFVWQLLRDRLPSGTKVLKRHGPGNGTCPLCHIPENGTHILFSCDAAQALWGFVREALGPEWEAHDLADFLQVWATQAGRKRRLFWLIFAALSWTLWTTRNKMVIERVFQRHASDSFFKFLAFLQHWHPLARPRDRVRLQGYLDALLMSARRLSPRPRDA